MPYQGTVPDSTHKQTFGIHFVSGPSGGNVILDGYRNGILVERVSHPDMSVGRTYVAMINFAGSAFHIDRIEWRDAPGGTLLQSDDFVTLNAWTPGNLFDWSISPASYAYSPGSDGGVTGNSMVGSNPNGTRYVELQNCYTDNPGTSFWTMIDLFCSSPPGPLNNPNGWRILLRGTGEQDFPNGTDIPFPSTAGWQVGKIGFG